jgi:hypothetical protein
MDSDESKQHMIYYLQSEVYRLKEENALLREQLDYKSLGRLSDEHITEVV